MGFQGANFDTINVLESLPLLSFHRNYCKFIGECIYSHIYIGNMMCNVVVRCWTLLLQNVCVCPV